MRDQTALIECRGGLNETVSELEVGAGEVRRSLNYEQVSEGGYSLMGGTRRYSGQHFVTNLDNILIVEVKPKIRQERHVYDDGGNFQFNAAVSGTPHRYIASIPRDDSELIITERDSATAGFILGEALGFNGAQTICDLEPELTESEQNISSLLVDFYGFSNASLPTGDGETCLIHGHYLLGEERVFVVRKNTDGSAYLQYAVDNSITPGTWNVAGLINQAGAGEHWEAYSYTFDGIGSLMFIVNGSMDTRVFGNGPLAQITVPGVALHPTHVVVHQNHLFLSFPNGRIVHSDIGDPYSFNAAVGGAGELGFGEEITGFQVLAGDSLAIFGRDRIGILSGTSAADWSLQIHTDEAGAIEGSIQNLPTTIFADKRGATTLNASDHYGNFTNKTLSHRFNPLYLRIIRNNKLFSSVHREKSQYRLYNQDGSGIHFTFTSNALVGGMETSVKRKITAMATVQHEFGDVVYFASDNGWVYRMDIGRNHVGQSMDAFLEFPYHHYSSPRQKKNFKEVALDLIGDPRVELNVTNSVERGEPFHCDGSPVEMDVRERIKPGHRTGLLSRFSQRFRGVAYIVGTGFDQSILITGETFRHTINSITVHYTWRGQKK